uniref:Uncharacterized protein n=1 Tax=Leptocylindrus danicus TaxID=163516 RepID=A0A7S2K335_9STRA|mmetsp:Transcript_16281/g.23985  ORF Transcript_16281/g.23985 Transcript_16281/m.23985 type:complete len:181 (+) Transcript_16281:120-662(+)|eukprot:CAMPEP_0116008446 /NCGR_PEP_ID=MMETSP0321-20121206/2866_1 /TAXON_ID=163516 /ORGANISM="Leptocylindrus danicus var. danicus, Strain B650" /LENGTH=180 /DNA_ID=CAMNT_0003477267 /DNA_START=33 /DNA_END=575 /DNA_ORIENTATION=-
MMLDARTSLNGVWRLDKSRGEPSMKGYLEVMGVTAMAIEAHEKGEKDVETRNNIELTGSKLRIKKTSRVNNLQEEFPIGQEIIKTLMGGGDRQKVTRVDSEGLHHVKITTQMPTMNGKAEVVDIKTLVTEDDGKTVLRQDLTIRNVDTGQTKTTERWFVPEALTEEIAFEENVDNSAEAT